MAIIITQEIKQDLKFKSLELKIYAYLFCDIKNYLVTMDTRHQIFLYLYICMLELTSVQAFSFGKNFVSF